ncbi:uncharacterized protein LOC124149386 [Haliotis rufescens]|uniref:uncharacterized protein LOC124149386 n=1 Tax=Haliotis rufescens TaxID=6454 RepID=UPI001EAFD80C|nr:uncharacterized protein LOC124149386 [Haliotis rufescens]
MKITTIVLCEFLIGVVCQISGLQECKTFFNLADETDSFSSTDILSVVNNSELLDCVSRCFRHTRCVGVRFAPSTGQCHMYATYQTQTTTGTGTTGDKYYIIKHLCGSPTPSLPSTYWRNDVIATSSACNDTTAFVGTSAAIFCVPGSSVWTQANGTCVNKTSPVSISGAHLHTVDSGFSLVATPTAATFDVTFIAGNGNYLLKIAVKIDLTKVNRNSRVSSSWQTSETPLAAPFPFQVDKMFTMDILSSESGFQCKVDGVTLFTFQHRLPRDSLDTIKITNVNIKTIILT